MHNICYYITGHGLGHLTRSLEIINYILCSNSNHKLHIVSAIDQSILINSLSNNYNISKDQLETSIMFYKRVLDSGAIQSDALNVSRLDTLNTYYNNIYQNRQTLIDFEIQFLQDSNIDIVLVDATPIAVRAAAATKCKVFILSNFSWDYIYSELLKDLDIDDNHKEEYAKMIEQVSSDYSCCNLYIQYPGICPVASCIESSKIVEGPLISRRPMKSKIQMRKEYNIVNKKVLLLGFGGHKFDFSILKGSLPDDEWVCFVLGSAAEEMPSPNFIAVSFDCYVPDLLVLADCCLGKIGYGFVSECLSANCPLIYISRKNWAEEAHLIKLLCTTYSAGLEMPYEDFISGNWSSYLLKASSCKWELQEYHNAKHAPQIVFNIIESYSSK